MKKINLIAFVAISFLSVSGLSFLVSDAGLSGEAEREFEPGYAEQWFREKKNEQGIIPTGLYSQWLAADQRAALRRNNNNPIDTVRELGPLNTTGGRTRAILIDWSNPAHVLAGSVSGGLWESNDRGANWSPVNEQELNLGITGITQSPFDASVIYYCTGEGRANSADVPGEGIFKSTDGGKTFTQLASTKTNTYMATCWAIEHSRTDTNMLFVGTHSGGLYRSLNGGTTWENVAAGQITDIICLPSGRVLYTLVGGGVYYSDSKGAKSTFTKATFPSPPAAGFSRVEFDFCRKYPSVLFAMCEGKGFSDPMQALYKSSDGGKTWVKKTTPSVGSGYQTYCVMLSVHPADSNKLVAGGVNTAYSSNGAGSWSSFANGHADQHTVAYFPDNANQFLLGSDGGVNQHSWGTSAVSGTYINRNNGYRVTQFYAGNFGPNGALCISGAQDNGSHRGNYSRVISVRGADGAYGHISQQDENLAYSSTQNEGIAMTTNFLSPSVSWNNISNSAFTGKVDFINAYQINYADGYQLYYRTGQGLWRTTDGGGSWTQITKTISGIKGIGVSEHENPTVYFGGSNSLFYRINNAASAAAGSEKSLNLSVPSNASASLINGIYVAPRTRDKLFVALSNYSSKPRAWRVDKADTDTPVWSNISGDLPANLPVNYLVCDPVMQDSMYFAATDFGLYYTTNGGKNWFKDTRIPNVAVHEVKIRGDRKLFVFTHGRGIFYLSLKPLFNVSVPKVQKTLAVKLWPNPATDEVRIEIPEGRPAQYTVIAASGAEVLSGKAENGVPVAVSSLAAGTYFMKVQSGSVVAVKKFVVRR